MKTLLISTLTVCLFYNLTAQVNFEIRPVGKTDAVAVVDGPIEVDFAPPLAQVEIKAIGTIQPGISYNIMLLDGQGKSHQIGSITTSGQWITTSAVIGIATLFGHQIEIKDNSGNAVHSFILSKKGEPKKDPLDSDPSRIFPSMTVSEYLGTLFQKIEVSTFGLKVTKSKETNYEGGDYSHIFLDQYGNTILGAIPQGISNRQYVVHVLYLTNKSNPNQITYSIKQTGGSFSSTLVFNNPNSFSNANLENTGTNNKPAQIKYEWAHTETLLRTSTNDIEFEVYRNTTDNQSPFNINKQLIVTHTIEMTDVYHVSFDIGLINTQLPSPTYELVPSVADPSMNVVKKSNDSNRGVVTAMATFYTSPIVLFRKHLLNHDVPDYKVTGRNFLDDHGLLERFYPAVGVALNETGFENLFVGLNWEVARGGSLFIGRHYGKVNRFNSPDGFEFEQTVTSQEQFDLSSTSKWKSNWAFGVNLDVRIISNLFPASAGSN